MVALKKGAPHHVREARHSGSANLDPAALKVDPAKLAAEATFDGISVLRTELHNCCTAAGVKPEWDDLLRDLDRLQEATVETDGKRVTVRTAPEGEVWRVFQVAGIALPPTRRDQPASRVRRNLRTVVPTR